MRHLQDLYRQFKTEDQRLQYLFDLRFSDVTCPSCKRKNAYHRHRNQPRYTCSCGDSQIYPRKGTIFENSPIPLGTWFLAVFLLCSSPEKVSARELERALNVSYATAWNMRKKIQSVMPKHEEGMPPSFHAVLKCCILPPTQKKERKSTKKTTHS